MLAAVSFLLHHRVERRLGALRALFDEARDGDFRRTYDVEGDPHADAVTAVGAAFNELRAELAPLVNADPATGCLNRRGFAIQMDRAIAEARRRQGDVALLAVDLDHFKQINDRFGHLIGDEVLYEIATMLSEAVSEEGVVARMGGEEFTVLLPWADAEAAGAVAERMMTKLRTRGCLALPQGTPVTMSIGIAAERIVEQRCRLRAARSRGRGALRRQAQRPRSRAALGARRSLARHAAHLRGRHRATVRREPAAPVPDPRRSEHAGSGLKVQTRVAGSATSCIVRPAESGRRGARPVRCWRLEAVTSARYARLFATRRR